MVKNVLNTLRKKQKNNKGFSLVELIVVIAIMAVLIGVLAPQFIKYVERSRQSTDLQNVQELKSAIEADIADGVIHEDTNNPIKITINGNLSGNDANTANKNTAVASVTPTATGVNTVKLKSSGWSEGSTEYVYTNGKWSTTSLENTNEPKRNMNEVFN